MGVEVGGGGRKKEKKEKIPLWESIDNQPLRGRCPAPTLNFNHDLPKQGTGTADHLRFFRLFFFIFIFFLPPLPADIPDLPKSRS